MYSFYFETKRVEKKLEYYRHVRKDIALKLERLMLDPRRALDAHPLSGKLQGCWSCWLGSNIRLLYVIDDLEKKIVVISVGDHTIY